MKYEGPAEIDMAIGKRGMTCIATEMVTIACPDPVSIKNMSCLSVIGGLS